MLRRRRRQRRSSVRNDHCAMTASALTVERRERRKTEVHGTRERRRVASARPFCQQCHAGAATLRGGGGGGSEQLRAQRVLRGDGVDAAGGGSVREQLQPVPLREAAVVPCTLR
eukprot:TRINITY_DN1339_c0_g1_i1.p4 TRINITY_DN1339_c0_g1~~TRINITY_DN1339_c0_g1_i1.p4  ORF type:complete len:114 (-),score=19.94 TRINITY_DN1339_c0_g1_i1:1556-1897(-)